MTNDLNGCRPCDCDVGGALGDTCDVVTGDCTCKPHIQGRQCNQVEPGHFFSRLDWYTYEAEFADGFGVSLDSVCYFMALLTCFLPFLLSHRMIYYFRLVLSSTQANVGISNQ